MDGAINLHTLKEFDLRWKDEIKWGFGLPSSGAGGGQAGGVGGRQGGGEGGEGFLGEGQVGDRKSTRLNSSHITRSRMPSSA